MKQLYLVDTSAWIFALRRNAVPAVSVRIGELVETDAAAICGVIELELLTGALTDQEFASLQRQLVGLHRLSIWERDWLVAGRLGFDLRRKGITIAAADLLVATLAIRSNTVLLHADRDFDLLAQHAPLRVESMVGFISPGKE